jgi:HAD superfamily phosphatase (TIGR01668 family)
VNPPDRRAREGHPVALPGAQAAAAGSAAALRARGAPRMLQQFCPDAYLLRLGDLTPEYARALGLRGLVLDFDNTLVPWQDHAVPPATESWVRQMRAAEVRLCVVSNTHRPRRLRQLAQQLGIVYVPGGGKPRRRGFRRALAALGLPPSQVAVVGDQLFTDIWGGNRMGLYTILVEPLSRREFWGTQLVSRPLEAMVLGQLRRRGLLSAVPGGTSPAPANEENSA